MYNGFTPTPTNKERVAYDAMREQEFLAMQLAAEQQRVNSTHYFEGLAKIEAEIVAIRTSAEDFGTRSIISGGEVLEIDDPHYYDSDYASWDGDPF